ncbi:MAG: hypothetical protein HRT47_01490 [Candidatus Caenarcaniphilales bacterium]|nr:hypothetical protein [Candidatus Caenarcaniphilales bacterium]
MTEQCYTVDESDPESPVKRFPAFRYLKEIVTEYFRSKTLVLNKSRRMMATHLGSAIMLHQFLFVPFSENIIVSINEESAKKVIGARCVALYRHLDKRFPYPELKEGKDIRVNGMINPVIHSRITGLPSGSDKCRGLTVTNAMYDELAFQHNVEENLKALKPAIEGQNCRAILVSTPRFNTKFQDLVTKIHKDSEFKEIMPGLTKSRNELNMTVLGLHYTADPRKRTKEWYFSERYGTTPDGEAIPGASGVDTYTWDQEYELKFTVPLGKPVVPEFSKILHCEPYASAGQYDSSRPLHASFDFGTHYPAVGFFQADSLNRCVIHGGIMGEDMELENFMAYVRDYIEREFPNADIHLHADPAGAYGNSQGTAAPAVKLLERFFKKRVNTRKSRPIDRARAIRSKFTRRVGDAMGVIVNPSAGMHIRTNGEILHGIMVTAFETGWTYKMPKPGEEYKDDDPEKDGYYDHLMDALGYGFINVFPMLYEKAVEFRSGKPRKVKSKRKSVRPRL